MPGVHIDMDGDQHGTRVVVRNLGRLPASIDIRTGQHTGTGLDLVRALLPRSGVDISLVAEGNEVRATLTLRPPVVVAVAVPSTPEAATDRKVRESASAEIVENA